MKEINTTEMETDSPKPDQELSVSVQERIEHWRGLTANDIETRIKRLDFIVDPWGRLDDYAELKLPKGWELSTTSRDGSLFGTILLASKIDRLNKKVKGALKQYVANHGLMLSQADTFIETLYYAKFTILPLLINVLNDKNLYRAYRNYSRALSREDYIKWINKYHLQHNEFNVKLNATERVRLAELIDRMIRADKKLRPMRDKLRLKREANTPA